jgi:TolA-binding protein
MSDWSYRAQPDVPPAGRFIEPQTVPVRRRRRLATAAKALVLLALIASTAGASFIAVTNRHRADAWQNRSVIAERNARSLNDLLIARTARLNEVAIKEQNASKALNQSESDVRSLEVRQRQLANEKAQVEDERAQLEEETSALGTVAGNFVTCKRDLVTAIQAVADENNVWLDAYGPEVDSECAAADSALNDFIATYP